MSSYKEAYPNYKAFARLFKLALKLKIKINFYGCLEVCGKMIFVIFVIDVGVAEV